MTDMQWISDNVAAFRAADSELELAYKAKYKEIVRRFHMDPEFHAHVYTAGRIVLRDVLPPERERGDSAGRWADALYAAITTVAVLETLKGADNE